MLQFQQNNVYAIGLTSPKFIVTREKMTPMEQTIKIIMLLFRMFI